MVTIVVVTLLLVVVVVPHRPLHGLVVRLARMHTHNRISLDINGTGQDDRRIMKGVVVVL